MGIETKQKLISLKLLKIRIMCNKILKSDGYLKLYFLLDNIYSI